jgi:integrase
MSRRTLSDKGVAALKPRKTRFTHSDPELRGHVIRVQPSGAKSYWTIARTPAGKQVWSFVGSADTLPIASARTKARSILERVRAGLPAIEAPPPAPPAPDSFKHVAENWLKRHVAAEGLRSRAEWTRLLKEHVYPRWADRAFLGIGRGDVTALLDEIEDDHGARQADHTLSVVSGIMRWQAARVDSYVPPIVKGMRRWNPKQNARSRTLSDDEIRAVWRAAKDSFAFGAFIQVALLTAQRRDKVASMRWDDIDADGTWTIPSEEREKGNAGKVRLPRLALDIIRAQPKMLGNPHVFAGRGAGCINGFSRSKVRFDKLLPSDMAGWTVHDLRRTARSLMSRAGVPSEHAERAMGHVIGGVRGIYDRYAYEQEKSDALKKLAALVDGIVNPRDNVVVTMNRRKRR